MKLLQGKLASLILALKNVANISDILLILDGIHHLQKEKKKANFCFVFCDFAAKFASTLETCFNNNAHFMNCFEVFSSNHCLLEHFSKTISISREKCARPKLCMQMTQTRKTL